MSPAPTFIPFWIRTNSELKNEKRSQRHAWGEEISAEMGFFYSLNVEVTGAARFHRAASVWTAGLGEM
ncbi:MAG: hypothetical protein WBH09_02300 [Rugosibacter sp.]